VDLDHNFVAVDAQTDGIQKLLESAITEKLDALARGAGAENVIIISDGIDLEEDMAAGELGRLSALAALGKVDGHGALSIGRRQQWTARGWGSTGRARRRCCGYSTLT